jgi:apolipoprotein N-acyltransferase
MGDHPVMATRAGAIGSMVIDINGLQLDAYMVDKYGVVRDQFRLTKGVTPAAVPTHSGAWGPWLLVLLLAAAGLSALTPTRANIE